MMLGKSLKDSARRLMFLNSPNLFFVSLLFLLIITVLSQMVYRLPGTIDFENMNSRLRAGEPLAFTMLYVDFRPVGALLAVLLYLFQPVLDAGFMSYCLKTKRGEDTGYKDIFNGFQIFLKVMGIFIITTIFIFLWGLLLIIPGVIAAYRYRLAYYILLDDPSKGILQCIDESTSMIRGGKLDLLTIDLSFLGWYALDMFITLLIPLPFMPRVVMIWLSPYRGITNAGFYEMRKNGVTV